MPEELGGLDGTVGGEAHQYENERDGEAVEPNIARFYLKEHLIPGAYIFACQKHEGAKDLFPNQMYQVQVLLRIDNFFIGNFHF